MNGRQTEEKLLNRMLEQWESWCSRCANFERGKGKTSCYLRLRLVVQKQPMATNNIEKFLDDKGMCKLYVPKEV